MTSAAMCLTAQAQKSAPWYTKQRHRHLVIDGTITIVHRTIVLRTMQFDDGIRGWSVDPLDAATVNRWLQEESIQWAYEHSVCPLEFVHENNVNMLTQQIILIAYFPGPLHTFWQLKWGNTVQQLRLPW